VETRSQAWSSNATDSPGTGTSAFSRTCGTSSPQLRCARAKGTFGPSQQQPSTESPSKYRRSVGASLRGGLWYDRPQRCTSSFRLAYEHYASVFNVGFRVILEDEERSWR